MMGARLGTGADHTEAVISSRQHRNVFAKENPRKPCLPHTELATNAVGGLRLGIERFELTRRAPEKDQDAGIRGRPGFRRARLLQAEQLRQGEANAPERSGSEQFAARWQMEGTRHRRFSKVVSRGPGLQ